MIAVFLEGKAVIEASFLLTERASPKPPPVSRRWSFYTALRFPSSTCAPKLRALPRLKSFGHDAVSVVCIYGFDTRLSEDYARWMMLRRHQLIPFFQEYWPIPGVRARVPADFFDMDLNGATAKTGRNTCDG